MKLLRSHPAHTHALSLSQIVKQTEEEYSDEKTCSGCEQEFPTGEEAYTCPKRDCEFSLHKSCFDLSKELQHKSHPGHKLTLLLDPPEFSLYYDSSGCGGLIDGFSFDCDKCDNFRLHVKCAFLPETVDSKAHEHTLAVRHYTPQPTDGLLYCSVVMCDVCESGITEGYWSYFCKDCNFVTDLQCAFTADAPPVKEEEEEEEEEEVDQEEEEEDVNEEEEEEEVDQEEEEDDVNEEEEEEEVDQEEEEDDVNEEEEEEVDQEEEDDVNEEDVNEEEEEEEDDDEFPEGATDAEKLLITTIKTQNQMAMLRLQQQLSKNNAKLMANMFRYCTNV